MLKTTVFFKSAWTDFYNSPAVPFDSDQHWLGLLGSNTCTGVVRTFQHIRLFREMTALKTCWWQGISNEKTGPFSGPLKTPLPSRPERNRATRGLSARFAEYANRQASTRAWR